ncbi:MAG: glycoside-pentoside-hexuronide (GPH):cation symporter [Spirochaetia bacterium]|nr:glycoside-pentoside-hexuronide (GPH):cation symporter [Spirochaetia bacterium]
MNNHLSSKKITVYSLPILTGGMMSFLTGNFLMKYATDVLLISPAVMGIIFLISRIWDAVNDPLCGFLSDHTQSQFGRRKSWILFSSLPIAFFFIMMWQPPDLLNEWQKNLWMGFSVILFFTALTALYIPHYSLGAELSPDFFEHNRVYGWRAVFENIGSFSAIGVILFLSSTNDPKNNSFIIMIILSLTSILLSFYMVFNLKDTEQKTKPVKSNFKHEFTDVLKNPHAKILLSVGFFSQTAASLAMASSLYYSEYILDNKEAGGYIIALFMLSATLFIPLWIFIAKKTGKKKLWIISQLSLGIGFLILFFLSKDQINFILTLAFLLGAFAGCIMVINPSMLADVIDYDHKKTGERKEGIYFSIFTFINKSAMGVSGFVIGTALSMASFIPSVKQTIISSYTIKTLFTLGPMICFFCGAFILSFYKLTKDKFEKGTL